MENLILVTGHRGFVGGHLTNYLDQQGIKWVGYDLVDGFDIRDKFKLESTFMEHPIDVVIHLAALASPIKSMMFPDEYVDTNIKGTQNLLECAKRYKIKRFISFSSSSVYGDQAPPNSEKEPYMPTSIYGITKTTSELLVKASDVPYTIIRPFTLYGLNGRKDQVIYKWINFLKQKKPITILGDGTTKRGYTYINDLVKAVVDLIDNKKAENETFNLGGTEVVTIEELAKLFQDTIKCEIDWKPEIQYAPLLKGDVYANYADISKAKELIGYDPPQNFRKNIENIIKHELCET